MRVRHVVPGNGGGDGSAARPFQGLDAAQKDARGGDLFLVHKGAYGAPFTVRRSGEAGNKARMFTGQAGWSAAFMAIAAFGVFHARQARSYALLVLLATVFVATWIGFRLSRRITEPLQELAAAIAEGVARWARGG
jgi:Flp pilus assembly protein TadB